MTTADRLAWRISSRNRNGVEVAPAADGVVMRHSKQPSAGTITFPAPRGGHSSTTLAAPECT